MTVSYLGPSYDVADVEVMERMAKYAYISTSDVRDRPLAVWFNREKHEKYWEKRAPQAYSWLELFMSPELARADEIHAVARSGPASAVNLLVAIRTLIRAKRKAKEPHPELLQALYQIALMADFYKALRFEYNGPNVLCEYVDAEDLRVIPKDFLKIRFLEVKALGKTDVKWLTEAFGQPAQHQAVADLWEPVRQNTISRYCWAEFRGAMKYRKSSGSAQQDMEIWLAERIKFGLGMEKENQARAAATLERYAERDVRLKEIEGIWDVTMAEFVVADLETTGLDPNSAEILEFAALVVHPSGQILSEFSGLVTVPSVPAEITGLTGITNDDVQREGRPLNDVFAGFIAAIGNRPLFFHNAPFDAGFLKKATGKTRLQLKNPIHDTLSMSRAAWPGMRSHALSTLVKIIEDAPIPTHRALGDARATLAVLLAARKVAGRG